MDELFGEFSNVTSGRLGRGGTNRVNAFPCFPISTTHKPTPTLTKQKTNKFSGTHKTYVWRLVPQQAGLYSLLQKSNINSVITQL